jgi:hypothetical protein
MAKIDPRKVITSHIVKTWYKLHKWLWTQKGKNKPMGHNINFRKNFRTQHFAFSFFANEKKQGSLCEQPVFAFELPEKKIITSNDDINFSFESKSSIRKLESALQYLDNIRCQYHQHSKSIFWTNILTLKSTNLKFKYKKAVYETFLQKAAHKMLVNLTKEGLRLKMFFCMSNAMLLDLLTLYRVNWQENYNGFR